MTTHAYLGCSLDGFIAGVNGELDWLEAFGGVDYGYDAFIANIDAIVIGRRTFDAVSAFPEWPYGTRTVVVLTTAPSTLSTSPYADRIRLRSGALRSILDELSREGAHAVYIDGGDTVRRCIEEQCLNELTLTMLPILLGDGIPLFIPGSMSTRQLQRTACTAFDNGAVQLRYTFSSERHEHE